MNGRGEPLPLVGRGRGGGRAARSAVTKRNHPHPHTLLHKGEGRSATGPASSANSHQIDRPAHRLDQQARVAEEAFRDALDVGQCHRGEEAVAFAEELRLEAVDGEAEGEVSKRSG